MYAVAGRAFGRTNLRPVVIVSTICAIVWSLVWAAGAFEDINGDKQNDELKKLVNFDIALGALYVGVAVIEFFGLLGAITRRTPMVRIYVGLSLLVVLIVAAAELLRTVVHFTFKSAIIDECTTESTGDRVRTSFGFWGSSSHTLNADDARDYCNDAYPRTSVSTIIWLLLALVLSLFFASTAYAFYRQLLDPTFNRAQRAPSNQVRLDAMNHQPYGGGYSPYPGFNPAQSYAPPAGPPPGLGGYSAPPYEAGKLPGYGAEFAPRDVGDEKEKNADPFVDSQHFGAGPSETELARPGYRV